MTDAKLPEVTGAIKRLIDHLEGGGGWAWNMLAPARAEHAALVAALREARRERDEARADIYNLRLIAETVRPGDHERAIATIALQEQERAAAAIRRAEEYKARMQSAERAGNRGQEMVNAEAKRAQAAEARLREMREKVEGLAKTWDVPTQHYGLRHREAAQALRAILSAGERAQDEKGKENDRG